MSDTRDQLTLALPALTRREAERRGLAVAEDAAARDQRLIGTVGAAIANLNYQLEQAAADGFEVLPEVHYQERGRGPKRAGLTARMRRLAVDVRV